MKIVRRLGASASLMIGISAAHSSIFNPGFSDFGLLGTRFDTSRTPGVFANTKEVVASQSTAHNISGQKAFLDTNELVDTKYPNTFSTPSGVFSDNAAQLNSSLIVDARWPPKRSTFISQIAADSIAGNMARENSTSKDEHRRNSANADASSENDPFKLAMLGLGLFGFAIVRRARRKSAK